MFFLPAGTKGNTFSAWATGTRIKRGPEPAGGKAIFGQSGFSATSAVGMPKPAAMARRFGDFW